MKKIVVASDKAGFELKEHIKKYLIEQGYEVSDVGTLDPDNSLLYYRSASNVATAIQKGEAEKGILCCGTGMGVSQIANKFEGVFAACCESVSSVFYCRSINDSNVLCMGGNLIGKGLGIDMVKTFLSTNFRDGVDEDRKAYLGSLRQDVINFDKELFN